MPFNFTIAGTPVKKSLQAWSFPLFRYANFLCSMCLIFFMASLCLLGISFVGFFDQVVAMRLALYSLIGVLVFFEINVFVEMKVKHPIQIKPLSEVLKGDDGYNLAEFLTLSTCQIVEDAIKICKKRKLAQIISEALFSALLAKSKAVQLLVFRLGIDHKKLQNDLKNYLEKLGRQSSIDLNPSNAFQKTIIQAAFIANERGRQQIGEKELLVALSKHDKFFKELLVAYDLKEKDIEHITLWLDDVEQKIVQSKKFWLKENLAKLGSIGKNWASGFTVTLDVFGIDWKDVVGKQDEREIIGHQEEIDELQMLLTKSDLKNVLIVGYPGVGRKSIVHALAQKCYLGNALPELNSKRVIELDMVALLARTPDEHSLQTNLAQIFEEAAASGNVILVIDQLENFVEHKAQTLGQVDISGVLSKYLAMPDFCFIGITSFEGLHQKLEKTPAFLEYFRKIEIAEVSELETIKILQDLSVRIEQKDKVLVAYPAIREIVNLAGRYFPSTPFPKKAIDILHEAIVYVKMLKEKVVEPRHIAKIISDKTQIPVGKMEFKEKSVLMNLENLIHERIVGQDEGISEIAIALRRSRSGIGSNKRPMGVFLFLGPTGVGKTETAKALADIYFNGEHNMIRIDMSEFQSAGDMPRLIGAVSPVDQQGLLTTPVRENPFSLVLLDEIEKANHDILNIFLQVFDEGHLTDGQGRKVIFNNTIIICTSNAGADKVFAMAEKGQDLDKREFMDSLVQSGIFKPEFINRFDAVVVFKPLTKENLLEITGLMLQSLQKNLKDKEVEFSVSDALKEKIVELSYKPEFGAREIRRVIADKVENAIAKALISDKIGKGDAIEIDAETFEIIKKL